MLNYHTTPQISAVQHYVSHITSLGGYSLWGDYIPSDGHSGTQTPPMLYCVHSLDLNPICIHQQKEARISQLWKDTGQFLCCCFGHNSCLWPQKRLGSLPTVLPRKGEELKFSATMNNSL